VAGAPPGPAGGAHSAPQSPSCRGKMTGQGKRAGQRGRKWESGKGKEEKGRMGRARRKGMKGVGLCPTRN